MNSDTLPLRLEPMFGIDFLATHFLVRHESGTILYSQQIQHLQTVQPGFSENPARRYVPSRAGFPRSVPDKAKHVVRQWECRLIQRSGTSLHAGSCRIRVLRAG